MPLGEPADGRSSQLLTIPEAAQRLRLRPSTVRAWILHRRIPFVKLGARVFLRCSDVEGLIAKSIVPARIGSVEVGSYGN